MRRRLLSCLILAILPMSAACKPVMRKPGPVSISVEAVGLARFAYGGPRFGALEFLGGLELSSPSGTFGGLSGLALDASGLRFTAISDAGLWVTGRLVETKGRLAGVADVEVAPMLGAGGRPLSRSGRGDAESLSISGGTAFVGIERVNEIDRFAYGRDGVMARAEQVPAPPGLSDWPGNRGLEAIGAAPPGTRLAGAILAISERSAGEDDPTAAFLVGGPDPGALSVRRSDGYDITDLAFLPGGDVLLLERRAEFPFCIGMRIRRIAAASVKPGAMLEGRVLIEAGLEAQIDNMEALAVSRDATGRTILTVMSDDNFSSLQRTLVLRFALADD